MAKAKPEKKEVKVAKVKKPAPAPVVDETETEEEDVEESPEESTDEDEEEAAEMPEGVDIEVPGKKKPEVAEEEEEGKPVRKTRVAIKGVPDKLPVQTEPYVAGKKTHALAIHFVATFNEVGKKALYNERGVRISPAYAESDLADPNDPSATPVKAWAYIAKMAARNNQLIRKNTLPGDFNRRG